MMRWGIVPWFAKTEDEFKALSTINAKSDNLTSSRMWREPFAKRRCLVPARIQPEQIAESTNAAIFVDKGNMQKVA